MGWLIAVLVLETLVIIALVLMLMFLEPWKQFWATIRQKPFLRVIIENTNGDEEGMVKVNANHNYQFLWKLDQAYTNLGNNTDYEANMPDHAKIAIFMDDITGDIAEPYRSDVGPSAEEMEEDGVPMFLNGGEEVKQVIDLADTLKQKGAKVDIAT